MGGKRNRVLGRCAGILFLTAAVASLPANQPLSAPRPAWWIHLIDLLGALTGAACLLVPWDRISRRWLHLIPPVAVAEIVLSVSALGQGCRTRLRPQAPPCGWPTTACTPPSEPLARALRARLSHGAGG